MSKTWRILSFFAVVVLACISLLTGTASGARGTLLLVDFFTGADLKITTDRIDGRLLGRLELANFQITSPSFDLELNKVDIDWRILSLLRGHIDIENLFITEGQLTLHDTPAEDSNDTGNSAPGLPHISLGDLAVKRLVINTADHTYTIDSLDARAALVDDQLILDMADLGMPELSASASGKIGLDRQLAMDDIRLDWSWHPARLLQPVTGTAKANGNSTKLVVEANLISPAKTTLAATLENLFDDAAWKASLATDHFNLQREVHSEMPDVGVEFSATLNGDNRAARLQANGNLEFDNVVHPWVLDADIPFTGNAYPDIELTSGQASFSLKPEKDNAEEAIAALDIPRMTALWPGLVGTLAANGKLQGPPLQPQIYMSVNGSDLTVGELGARRIQSQLQFDSSLSPGSELKLFAEINEGRISSYHFNGNTEITGSPAKAMLDLHLEDASNGTLSLQMDGGMSNSTLTSRINALNLSHPELGNWAATAPSTLIANADSFELERLCLNQQQSGLCSEVKWANNKLSTRLELKSLLLEKLPLLAMLSDYPVGGTVNGQIATEIDGTHIKQFAIDLSLAGGYIAKEDQDIITRWPINSLTMKGQQAGKDRLQIEAQMVDQHQGSAKLSLYLPSDLAALSDMSAPLDGNLVASLPDIEKLNVLLENPVIPPGRLDADIKLGGTFSAPRLKGRTSADVPLIELGEPATQLKQTSLVLLLDDRNLELTGKSMLDGHPLTLDGKGTLTSLEDWQASARVKASELRLSALDSLNKQSDYSIDGQLSLLVDAAFDQDIRFTRLDGDIRIENGMLRRTFLDGDSEALSLNQLKINSKLANNTIVLSGSLRDRENGSLDMHMSLPSSLAEILDENMPLETVLKADLPQLKIISIFLEDVSIPNGSFTADISATGTRASPVLAGDSKLRIARLELAEPNIVFDDSTLDLQLEAKDLTLDGQTSIAGRPVKISGNAHLESLDQWNTDLQLTGESLQLDNVYGSSLVTSPDLALSIEPGQVELTGKLDIESSQIVFPDIGTTVRPSSDVRIIGDEGPENRHWIIKTDISAELQGQNRLRAAGFNGLLSGNIRVHSETGDLTTADGRLTIAEGTYRAYGAEVPIRSGQIEFVGGSLDDPAITIVSRKTIEQKEVGFDVTGTLKTPIVTLVSSPEMDQSEILSWLLYGRASDDVQGAGTAILANTIRESLGDEEEESFVQRIFGKMGMSDLGIEADVAITRGVGLRKQLTPRMQIKYQLDIWEQTTRLILRYKLNDHWSVEGISGDMGGGDILYERER